MNETKVQEIKYRHVVMEGTAYEVGKLQGQWVQNDPEAVKFFTSPLEGKNDPTPEEAIKLFTFFDQHCPGLNEELQGFADTLGAPVEKIVYYPFTYSFGNQISRTGNCSHMALLPAVTADGHVYVGRSYEWNLQDDFRLCTTRIEGKAAHLGFSLLQFGRIDGINEYGLAITMSAGCPMVETTEEGFRFWAVIRTLLDHCRTVPEALDRVQSIPIAFNLNLLLTDKNGESALIEMFSSRRAVKRIGPDTPEQTLWSTNHYNLPGMMDCDLGRMGMSVVRYQKIASVLGKPDLKIGKEELRQLLTESIPEGLSCHYYHDYFGTLWSEIFDLTTGTAEICFGSPVVNEWRPFGLDTPAGLMEYSAKLPLESPERPDLFFRKMAPGALE